MAELNDVYGQNYLDESKQSKNNYVINTIANNIAHRQFNFKLFDSSDLWDINNNLLPQAIETLSKKIKAINKWMHVQHLDKKNDCVNMLPELVIDSPVEYFLIIDGEFRRAYFIHITPFGVNAY